MRMAMGGASSTPQLQSTTSPKVRASLTHTEQTLLVRGEALREASKRVGRRSAKASNRRCTKADSVFCR